MLKMYTKQREFNLNTTAKFADEKFLVPRIGAYVHQTFRRDLPRKGSFPKSRLRPALGRVYFRQTPPNMSNSRLTPKQRIAHSP